MSYNFLNSYLIKDGEKINPNCRRLITSKCELHLFETAAKELLNKNFNELSTLDLTELFWLGLGKGEPGRCLTCSAAVKFGGWKIGYTKFCDTSCQMQHPEQQSIRKQDALKRFGVNSYLQTPKSKEKTKKTKSTPEYSERHKTAIRSVWEDANRKADVVQRMLASRKEKATGLSWSKQFPQKSKALNDANFTIIETTPYGKPLRVKHTDCDQEQWFGRFSNSGRYLCAACHPNPRTKSESEFLDDLSAALEINIKRNVRIGRYKIDGVVGNVGIDYNGLFWHSGAASAAGFGEHNPNYHHERWKICKDAGVMLLQVFEDEWMNNREMILSRIKHALNVSTTRYHARKCSVLEIPISTARKFLIDHHSAKSVPCKLAVGLFFENCLIAVATFGKTRFGKNRNDIELLRFCSIGSVAGGLSKLIKFVLIRLSADRIISYSDNFWGSGEGYQSAGFLLEREVLPGYFYFDKKHFVRRPRQVMRKDQFTKVFGKTWDPMLSEEQNAKTVDCYQVFDAGKRLWIFNKRSDK